MSSEEVPPEEDKMDEAQWDYEAELHGAVILRQIPHDRLADRISFALKAEPSPAQLKEAKDWVKATVDPGKTDVVFANNDGFLVKKTCEDFETYYEWIEGPSLLVVEDGMLENWGHSMIQHYGWEIAASWF